MTTIVTRAGKGSPLSFAEMDANFTNLNNEKAEVDSPIFTGNPRAPTPTAGDNDTSIATTQFVQTAIGGLLNNAALTGNPTAPTPPPGDNNTSVATTAFVQTELSVIANSKVPTERQGILNAPETFTGFVLTPNFLPATNGSLSISTINISPSTPFVVSAANGRDSSFFPVQRIGVSTINLTWTSLSPNSAHFLYVDVAANGTLTTGFSLLQPRTTDSTLISVSPSTADQHHFYVNPGFMVVGNGTTTNQVWRVFVGEAFTNASTVTRTVMYDIGTGPLSSKIKCQTNYASMSGVVGEIPRLFIPEWAKEIAVDFTAAMSTTTGDFIIQPGSANGWAGLAGGVGSVSTAFRVTTTLNTYSDSARFAIHRNGFNSGAWVGRAVFQRATPLGTSFEAWSGFCSVHNTVGGSQQVLTTGRLTTGFSGFEFFRRLRFNTISGTETFVGDIGVSYTT